MIMMLKTVVLLFVLLWCCVSVEIGSTKINTNRNSFRTSVCEYYSKNFTDQERSQTQSLINRYSLLSDEEIQKFAFEQQPPTPDTQIILAIAPHCLCLLILLIMWPGLCCCCVWPEKYPICKRFRKDEKQMYGKCQLKWPGYLAICAYLLIVVGASAALSGGPEVTNHFNNIGCKILSLADDTLNGRISPSDDTVFFIGLNPLKSQLQSFNSKLDTVFSNSNTSLNNSQNVRTRQAGIESIISGQYTSFVGDTYTSVFRQADGTTYKSIPSQFKTLYYGPETDSSKILGNINSQLNVIFTQINNALDPMITQWLYLNTQTEATVSARMNATIDKITTHQTQLQATINQYDYFDKSRTFTTINIAIKMLYGFILALALLGLIAAVVITCCTVVRIRLIIYCTCSFLIFFGVITFVLAIGLGLMVPNVAEFCRYADTKLSTPEGIESLFTKLQFNSSAHLYKDCYGSSATGDMIIQVNPEYQPDFIALDFITDQTLKFNDLIPTFTSSNFQTPFDQSAVIVQNVKQCKVLDFTDSTAISFISNVANKVYSVDVGCHSTNVNADSWVPTRDVASCQSGTFAQPVCTDLSDHVVCPSGCYEVYWELNDPQGDPSSYTTHLDTRYNSPCNYANFVKEMHQNWAVPRISKMATVTTNLGTIQTNVDTYDTEMKTIQASLNSFKSTLQTNFNSETNLTSGSFNGVDCRVMGETIVELRDSVCVGFLFAFNYNYIMLLIISYSILLLSCFSVCTGVRHFQHLQKMNIKVGYKGVPISVSSNRIIDKFDT